jgi:Protein of unknown function (DUF2833)
VFNYRTFSVRKATETDAIAIASELRKEDLIEMRSFHENVNPSVTLIEGVNLSTDQCWTILDTSQIPVAIFGVTPVIQGLYGAVWMLGTDRIRLISTEFLRKCLDWMPLLHKNHPLIGNVVFAGNKLHIKWLKYMGFSFINKYNKLGTMDLPFYEFVHKA